MVWRDLGLNPGLPDQWQILYLLGQWDEGTCSIISMNISLNQSKSTNNPIFASILLYGCTTWTLTKRLEKKLDGNYTRMMRAILNKSRRQHPTKHQLYGHLPPITKTIQVTRTRHAGHCWRSSDELISDVLLRTPTHGHAKAWRPARKYIQQLCEDTGCCPEDLPEAMNDREKWRERVRDIRATSTTWWWWWLLSLTTSTLQKGTDKYKHASFLIFVSYFYKIISWKSFILHVIQEKLRKFRYKYYQTILILQGYELFRV